MTLKEYAAARSAASGPYRQLVTPAFAATRLAKTKAPKRPNRSNLADPAPQGPLQIIVSIGRQRVTLYSGGVAVAEAPISTGTAEHPTPTGVFSVIQKSRFHRSNIYSNAPMPFMQRITWSGVALHEGILPGYPASHGCIRLPKEFAQRLWSLTKLGTRVIVARSDVAPTDITHPALFTPRPQPIAPNESTPTRNERKATEATSIAPGLRPSIAEIGASSTAPDSTMLARSAAKAVPAIVIKVSDRKTADASATAVDATVIDVPYAGSALKLRPAKSDSAETGKEPPLRPGPVSVFVSRKEGRLFVRKGFDTVFDMPVTIRNPDQPLGTHIFTAMAFANDGVRWMSVTMPGDPPSHKTEGHPKITPQEVRPKGMTMAVADTHNPPSARDALDRLEMPKEAVERISAMLSPGASLIISDQGRGDETGIETDFIVLTR